jgi:hypothetical protein
MLVSGEFVHTRGSDRHPVFMVLELARNADLHVILHRLGRLDGPPAGSRL